VKRLPRWLRILLIAGALVIAAGLILPYFLDVDRYRTFIASLVESKTGRKVRIGKIRAWLLPTVGFVVEDFGLSNPPGFLEGEVLAVEKIRGNLAWGPLLRREFRVSSVELVHPKVMLVEDDRGQTNYGSSPSRSGVSNPASQASAKAAEKTGTLPSDSAAEVAAVDLLELTDAEVTVAHLPPRARDMRAAIPYVHASKIRAELSHIALDPLRPRLWQGRVRLDGVQLELPGWKSPITFRSGQLELRDGHLESEFSMNFGKAAEFKGALHVPDIERGMVEFELTAAQVDVDQLLAMRTQTARAAPSAPTHPPRSELAAQGRLAAEHVRWQPYEARNAAGEIRVYTDRIELWPFTVELYGGTLQVSARADRTEASERFSSNVQVRNVNMGALMAASPSTRGKLSGTGELDLQLFGSLNNDWRKSLSGTGRFTIRDGRLPGVNLAGVLESIARVTGVGGETPFSVIQGDLSISQGSVSSRQIHMDSPHGTVDLHGSCSLEGALDYDGQVVLAPGAAASGGQGPAQAIGALIGGVIQSDVGRVTVPISIRGTLHDLKFQPGRGAPRIESPQSLPQTNPLQPQKSKSILDIFRRP
jgi:hypothetical protein